MPSTDHKKMAVNGASPGFGLPIARRRLLWSLTALCAFPLAAQPTQPAKAPALMLANLYRSNIDLSAYWVSEKYDGVRGYWDGRRLLTRGGIEVKAPAWFTAGWPEHAMDGELWGGRGRFERTVSTVRSQEPNDGAWRDVRFMVFDLPQHTGTFEQRMPAIAAAVARVNQPWVLAAAQVQVSNAAALREKLNTVVKHGGEGLMLHRGDSLYQGVRSDDLLKLKLYEDADAQVVQHLPGNGKYQGLLGALVVQTAEGKIFRIGSGFSDALRRNPPPIGSWISYRFRGTHERSGLPRFATFLRHREDAALNGLPSAIPTPPR